MTVFFVLLFGIIATAQLRNFSVILIARSNATMTAIENLNAAVAANATVTGSCLTLLKNLKVALDDAIAGGNTDPAIQQIADMLGTENQAIADAIVANTPAAP